MAGIYKIHRGGRSICADSSPKSSYTFQLSSVLGRRATEPYTKLFLTTNPLVVYALTSGACSPTSNRPKVGGVNRSVLMLVVLLVLLRIGHLAIATARGEPVAGRRRHRHLAHKLMFYLMRIRLPVVIDDHYLTAWREDRRGKMSRIYRMRRAVYYCAGGLMLVTFLPHAAPTLIVKRYRVTIECMCWR